MQMHVRANARARTNREDREERDGRGGGGGRLTLRDASHLNLLLSRSNLSTQEAHPRRRC